MVTSLPVLWSRSRLFPKRSPFPSSPESTRRSGSTLRSVFPGYGLPRRPSGNDIVRHRCDGAAADHACKDHGLQYLLAASALTGVLQLAAGYLKLGSLMRYVSRSVVTGFVNALAILIFMAQLPELTNVTARLCPDRCGHGHHLSLPYLNKTIPSPLVCIIVLTAISMWLHSTCAPWVTWANCRTACRCF